MYSWKNRWFLEPGTEAGTGTGRQRVSDGEIQYEKYDSKGNRVWESMGSAAEFGIGLSGEPDVTIQFSGSGSYNSRLLANGVPYTGRRFEAYYEDGLYMGYTSADPRAAFVEEYGKTAYSGGSQGNSEYKANLDQVLSQIGFGGAAATSTTGSSVRSLVASGKISQPQVSAIIQGRAGNALAALQKSAIDPQTLDAFKILEDTFTGYGLSELIPEIRKYMLNNIQPNEAALLLKSTPAYLERFKGNEQRYKQGLNVYTEAEYIAHEKEYGELFKQYGVPQFANRTEFAYLIGNDITRVDVNERLKLAVINTQNADPNIKRQLKQFYPQITDADLVAYFLRPDQTLQSLQLKVSSASVAAAAAAQGLGMTGEGVLGQRARAEQIATMLGPTSPEDVLAAAKTGFQKVSAVLPFAQKLTSIYGGQTSGYAQTEAEQEFLLGGQEEARKRAGLTALEEAQFQGRSGIDYQINPLGRSIQGTF